MFHFVLYALVSSSRGNTSFYSTSPIGPTHVPYHPLFALPLPPSPSPLPLLPSSPAHLEETASKHLPSNISFIPPSPLTSLPAPLPTPCFHFPSPPHAFVPPRSISPPSRSPSPLPPPTAWRSPQRRASPYRCTAPSFGTTSSLPASFPPLRPFPPPPHSSPITPFPLVAFPIA
ncbi:unnamed protein product [Closterium sp. NIES-54]